MRATLTLLCCLWFGSAWLTAAEATPNHPLFEEARRVLRDLESKQLPAPNPDQETELDLLHAMAQGNQAVDLAFYNRLHLDEVTDRLLPALNDPFASTNVGGSQAVTMLFLMRGHKLCKEGKVAEGQAWLLKAHRMARRPQADGNLLHLLTAISLEHIALAADGAYIGAWPESDRRAYVRSLETLPPMAGLRVAVLQDDLSLNEPTRFRTLLPKLKPLPPAERRKKLLETFPAVQDFDEEFQRCYEGLIDNVTSEEWDPLLQNIAGQLEPLNAEKLRAFKARVMAAKDFAKDPATRAEAFYLALLGAPIERTAAVRLDLDLKIQLLKVALQRGAAFDAGDLAGLASVADGPLKLGVTEDGKRRAILAGERGHYFMSLERKR
jgi:hypothetical protein